MPAAYKQGQMTLVATEFLRRFFLHVLPKGFVRIRHFGFLANRFRASRLALGRQLLASGDSTEQEVKTNNARSESSSLWHCPRCGASMIRVSCPRRFRSSLATNRPGLELHASTSLCQGGGFEPDFSRSLEADLQNATVGAHQPSGFRTRKRHCPISCHTG
jgi:Putative transposase